jgi:outer membrane protein assembly factor BamB
MKIETMYRVVTLSLVLGLLAASPLAAASPDAPAGWAQWRGPNRDGKSLDTGLMKVWPEGGPKQLWKVTGLGSGFSTVSMANGLIYTTGMSEDPAGDRTTSRLVMTAVTSEGKVAWSKELGKAYTGSYRGARATPTIHNGNIYLQTGKGLMGCYDAKTGEKKWTRDCEEFGGKSANWGYTESNLIIGDHVIITPGGKSCFMVALNKKTGKTVWKSSPFGFPNYSSPIYVVYKGVPMIITAGRQGLVAFNPKTGKKLWSHAFAVKNTANCPDPAFADGYVFWAVGYGKGCVCLKLSVEGKKVTATEAWKNKNMVCHHGGYVILDGYIYGNHSKGWSCLDLKTGDVKWNNDGVGKGSLCYADGMLYLYGEKEGKVGLAAATPKEFKMGNTFNVEGKGPSWAHPVVNGGKLYLRYDNNLYCFDVKK